MLTSTFVVVNFDDKVTDVYLSKISKLFASLCHLYCYLVGNPENRFSLTAGLVYHTKKCPCNI